MVKINFVPVGFEKAKSLVESFDPKQGEILALKIEGTPTPELGAWLISLSQKLAEESPNVMLVGQFEFMNLNRWTGEVKVLSKNFIGRADPTSAGKVADIMSANIPHLMKGVLPYSATELALIPQNNSGPW